MAALAEEVDGRGRDRARASLVFSRRSVEHGGRAWTSDDVGAAASPPSLPRKGVGAVRPLAGRRAAAGHAGIAVCTLTDADGADILIQVDEKLLSRGPAQFARLRTARPKRR